MPFVDAKVIRSTAPINGRAVTVYRPVAPIHRLFVSARANGDWTICHDLGSAKELSMWSALAAQSADSVIWIQKSGDNPVWRLEGYEPCDLVLCHHSLQLKPSSWKEARAYARKNGRPETLSVLVPEEGDEQYELPLEDYRHLWRKMSPPPGADLADLGLHANTVFIVGSRVLFEVLADNMRFQTTSKSTGDHTHLFNRARETFYESNGTDITIVYHEPKDWVNPARQQWDV